MQVGHRVRLRRTKEHFLNVQQHCRPENTSNDEIQNGRHQKSDMLNNYYKCHRAICDTFFLTFLLHYFNTQRLM